MVHKINYEFLEENDNYDDANIELEASRVTKSIDDFLSRSPEKKYGMIGYIGPFGCGKSSVINKIKSQNKSGNNQWLQFDAWKYPDRKELWDGFILDIVGQLGLFEDKEILKHIKSGIDPIEQGKNDSKTRITGIISAIIESVQYNLPNDQGSIGLKVPDFIKNGFSNSGSKISRITEYQELLFWYILYFIKQQSISNKFDGNIYIVIEDIDRGNIEEGLTFLETLRHFLSTIWNNYGGTLIKIIPIILIDKDSFEKDEHQKRFIKILDKVIFSEIKYDWVGFLDELIGGVKLQEESFFSSCITNVGALNKSTPREIKFLLRNILYTHKPDSKYPEFSSIIIIILIVLYLSHFDYKINYKDTISHIEGIVENYNSRLNHRNPNNQPITLIGAYFDRNDIFGSLGKYFIEGYEQDIMDLQFVGSTPSGDIEIAKGSIQCKFPITLLNN